MNKKKNNNKQNGNDKNRAQAGKYAYAKKKNEN